MRRQRFDMLPAIAAASFLIGASLLEPLAVGKTSPRAPSDAEAFASAHKAAEIGPAGRAIAQCDLAQAEALLADPAGRRADQAGAPSTDLILGLASERCGKFAAAMDRLQGEPSEDAYRDWRLLALARSAIKLGQHRAASAALESLRNEHASSPLFEQAILAESGLAELRGDLERVAEIALQGRRWKLRPDTSESLEVSAWRAGTSLGDRTIRRTAAARLLSEHPLTASELEVIEDFRSRDGSLVWHEILTPDQLVRRAETLLQAGLKEPAMSALEEVPEAARGRRWQLTAAHVLTASGEGEKALAILDDMPAGRGRNRGERAWQQALAALEVSAPKSGRDLTALQRKMMRDRAHAHLEEAIAHDLDPERTRRAFRILFEDALEDDLFEQALESLRRLKALDPGDHTGTRQLWRLGWKQYNESNFSGAIGYWSELSSLYPRSTYNRSGLYWAARAHEALGNEERSRLLLDQVVQVPFTDFYRRHALRRLGQEAPSEDEPPRPTEPWPRHPALVRAETLLSMGLHEAARVEIDALAPHLEHRPVRALRALALSAGNERRQSIIEIKAAFPLLGTPFQGMAPERARFLYFPLAFDEIIARHSKQNGLDRNMVLAMIRQESAFDPGALSWAGARGLMQVMPATGREIARRLGLEYGRDQLSEPGFSIQLGTTYYKQIRSMFDGDDELSLAGYNAGPYRIKRLWRQAGAQAEMDRFLETLGLKETRSYVKRVLLFADSYDRLYSSAG